MFEKEMNEVLKGESLTNEEREQIESALIANACASVQKTEDLMKFRANLEAFQSQCGAEEERIANRRAQAERLSEKIKNGVAAYMTAKGIDKMDAGTFKLSFRESSSVEIDDLKSLPDRFKDRVVTEKPDKIAIKAEVKANPGMEMCGFHIATNRNLQIK
jgi:hypothetical protein